MIESAVSHIQELIISYGAWGVLLATFVEEIIAPIPSALVPLAAGFFLLPADHSLSQVAFESAFLVAFPVAVGIAVGSAAVYWIAYVGGKPIIDRYGKYAGLSWADIEAIERKMTKGRRDEVSLFALRMFPIIPGVAISGFCGALRYRFDRFVLITFIAAGIRAYVLGLLGWQAGEYYTQYIDTVSAYEDVLLKGILIAAFLAVFVHFARARRRRQQRNSS